MQKSTLNTLSVKFYHRPLNYTTKVMENMATIIFRTSHTGKNPLDLLRNDKL